MGLIAAATLTGVALAEDLRRISGVSKLELGKQTVRRYASDAYPRWLLAHPDRTCPAALNELNEFMNHKDIKDPWGEDYELYCDRRGLFVYSLGEDGVRGTADDLWSNQP